MTDIEKMAREAGLYFWPESFGHSEQKAKWEGSPEQLERFAQAVARRCAELCEGMGDGPFAKGWESADYAAAIRAEFGIKEVP